MIILISLCLLLCEESVLYVVIYNSISTQVTARYTSAYIANVQKGEARRSPGRAYALGDGVPPRLGG